MKTIKKLAKGASAAALCAALAFGAMTASSDVAEAAGRPIFLCGPTLRWGCIGLGGPTYLFIGTVCEANAYQLANRRVCTPIGK